MFDVFCWLLISSALCLFLYFYVSNIWPGQYGIRQSPFFIFQKSYYVPNRVDVQSEVQALNFSSNGFENFPHLNQNAIVRIRNLTKAYGPQTVVKNFSMDIYKNQITVLLGHNGAGKTSTMCIITGLIPKTSGHVYVENDDNVEFYRSKIGYCPQHNISLPYLTCQEHLEFFGQLRGLSQSNAQDEATSILKKVNLSSKANEVAKKLSGGMLRKLCLANAIIGDTKLLILDEPSSGLDPESRRDIWNILLKLKKDHTILITSHFMEEADVLGDKIAIMETGELIAFGTSMFLKHYYGSGYTLKMLKCDDKTKFDRTSVNNTIKRHIPSAEHKTSVEPLYCMTLPFKDKGKYGEMLKELEINQKLFGIESLSITNTTLEEVFLKSANCGKIEAVEDEVDAHDYSSMPIDDPKSINRKLIFFRQFQAIFYKKFIYWSRNLPFFSAMVAIPIILTWLCFVLNNYLADKSLDTLKLQMSDIKDPFIIVNFKDFHNVNMEKILVESGETQKARVLVLRDKDIDQEILSVSENLLEYYDNLIGAVEFQQNNDKWKAKVFYSQNLLHSVAIMINVVDDAMLKFYNNPSYSIEVTNSPLNRRDENINYIQNLYTEFVPIGLMLMMIMFLPFTFKEKATGFKNLQNIPPAIYWSAVFLSDLIVHAIVVVVIMLITTYDRDGLAFKTEELETISILFFFYGVANLVIVYITSQCFSTLSSCIMFLNYLQIFSLFGAIIMSSSKEAMSSYIALISLFHILPDFALKHTLKVIHEYHKFERNHFKVGNTRESEVYQKSLAEYAHVFEISQFFMANVVVFLIGALFMFLVVENQHLMEQFNYFCSKVQVCWCLGKSETKSDESIAMDDLENDDDVRHEKKNVDDLVREEKVETEAMVVAKLTKFYGGKFKAVDDISFTVKKGECFGLLGMNGAGKTTTFEMMTMNRPKTSGTVFINGVNADEDRFLYRHMFGYCPQQDALCDYMTARELLKYMLMINGCNRYDLDAHVEKWLRKVDIEKYRDRRVSSYSGGTKRKLNTAMSMIADPYIIFLDEPTTGVDPKSRRFVWSCIKQLQQHQKTIVLTSHSMDECEMLCNRLGIMKNGEMKCIGLIQKLKEKYGKGFSLMIKCKPKTVEKESYGAMEVSRTETDSIDSSPPAIESVTDIKLQLQSLFTCELKDEHDVSFSHRCHLSYLSAIFLFTGRSPVFHSCEEHQLGDGLRKPSRVLKRSRRRHRQLCDPRNDSRRYFPAVS